MVSFLEGPMAIYKPNRFLRVFIPALLFFAVLSANRGEAQDLSDYTLKVMVSVDNPYPGWWVYGFTNWDSRDQMMVFWVLGLPFTSEYIGVATEDGWWHWVGLQDKGSIFTRYWAYPNTGNDIPAYNKKYPVGLPEELRRRL